MFQRENVMYDCLSGVDMPVIVQDAGERISISVKEERLQFGSVVGVGPVERRDL